MASQQGATDGDIGTESDESTMTTLSYLVPPMTGLLGLLAADETDEFARFHAWQAIIWGLIQGIVAVPTLGVSVLFLYPTNIFLMYKAHTGSAFELPLIGGIARNRL